MLPMGEVRQGLRTTIGYSETMGDLDKDNVKGVVRGRKPAWRRLRREEE
jgi:hypothetical protein